MIKRELLEMFGCEFVPGLATSFHRDYENDGNFTVIGWNDNSDTVNVTVRVSPYQHFNEEIDLTSIALTPSGLIEKIREFLTLACGEKSNWVP